MGSVLQLTTGEHTRGIAVNQNGQQQSGMKRRTSAGAVGTFQGLQVQLLDDFNDKSRQVLLWQPVAHRRREQVVHVTFDGFEPAHKITLNLLINMRNYISLRR